MNSWKLDIVTGIGSIAFASFVLVFAIRFPEPRGADFGPALFPRVIATILIILGALVLIQARKLRTQPPAECEPDPLDEEVTASFHGLRNVAVTVVVLVIYIAVVKTTGFIPTTLVMLFVLMKTYGVSVLRSVLFSCLITAFVYVLFAVLLRVVLP